MDTSAPSSEVAEPVGQRKFGYGNWLQPIINANDRSDSASDDARGTASPPPRATLRRGRGRPSIAKLRNDSAIEKKRRAQVREAQRTYQKRKDTATAIEKRRADDLLSILSDLSTEVENLLQAAAEAGSMHGDDNVSKNIQRLWSMYDNVVHNECIKPEMRLLQLKNDRRVAAHQGRASSHIAGASSAPHAITNVEAVVNTGAITDIGPVDMPSTTLIPALRFDLVRFEGTTVMSSYQRTAATDSYMAGRSIFEIVKERQAALKATDGRENAQNNQSG